jgi:hypothetical protein
MTTSLSNHGPSAHAIEARKRIERLSGFSPDQLTDGMMWLAGYAPEVFDAVLDTIDVESLTADGPQDPAPVCSRCGADIGIFIKFGLDWRHYREGTALGQAEIFDPGHAPELAWRPPGPNPAAI